MAPGQLALVPAEAAPLNDLVALPYIDELNKEENILVERLLQEEVLSGTVKSGSLHAKAALLIICLHRLPGAANSRWTT